MKTKAFVLRSRPDGEPTKQDFEIQDLELGAPQRKQLLIETICYTVDPYMRGRMNKSESYAASFEVGKPLDGGVVGKVLESEHPKFEKGDLVASDSGGWRTHALVEGDQCRLVDTDKFEPSDYLGAAGMPGITAYAGFFYVGRPVAGETVMVSAATGAVGSLVCQFAKLSGCRVIGSAGSDEKVAYLKNELKIDAAFNYKKVDSISKAFAEHAPQGIDIYWENVGGDFLQAALSNMNVNGRIATCGMISIYNEKTPPPGPSNLIQVIGKRLRIEGFLSFDHFDKFPEYLSKLARWKKNGQVSWETTRVKGFEKGADAFLGLFSGDNLGKMVVEVEPDQ
jgi:NADPH-dependent curcumin reductase CurA